ncbi:UNVERIFIED_CONTAM: hypothetical protein Scaly_3018700 [Sesamum calycinum]|uniref:Uncharacterized protein n=1 Tax=Sesamum calycinum TaxID=2727403 RepID=A0AAW2KDN0_9LAMI
MEPFPSRPSSSHLNICYYHQDPHRRSLRPGSCPGFAATATPSYSSGPGSCPDGRTKDLHVSIAEGLYQSFSGFARSGIVHHLSVPTGTLTRTLLRRSRSGGTARRTGGTTRRTLRSVFLGAFRTGGFDNDPSAGSPTETLLRLLLPLNDKVQWTSRDVAGSEPPTSPRSEHFIGPFNR